MIIFPKHFIQIDAYPGYYWNDKEQWLYSLKSGVLKKLSMKKPFTYFSPRYGRVDLGNHYQISHKGKPVTLKVNDLKNLKWSKKKEQHFPVQGDLF